LIVASVWYLIITSILMVFQAMLEKHFGKGFEAKDIVNNAQINSNAAKRGDNAIKANSDAVKGRNNATMLGFNA
ncbi:MAG: amino acid ABC transporter permease, partial [Gardnerella vaginalis]